MLKEKKLFFFHSRQLEKIKRNRKKLLRSSGSFDCEKQQISQICIRFKEFKWWLHQIETTLANQWRLTNADTHRINKSASAERTFMDIKHRPWARILSIKVVRSNKKALQLWNNGGKVNGYYRFKKGLHILSKNPTIFMEKIDKSMNYQTPMRMNEEVLSNKSGKNIGKLFHITRETSWSRTPSKWGKIQFFRYRNNLAGAQSKRTRNKTEQIKDKNRSAYKTTDVR